jgi:hypothetical protein
MVTGAVHELPVRRRHLAIDERGIGLRATWHFDRGLVNLSLWRKDRCVETFHLPAREAARLITFLVDGLADAVAEPVPHLTVAPQPAPVQQRTVMRVREELAGALDRAAARLRP